jgi:hypothetical protein
MQQQIGFSFRQVFKRISLVSAVEAAFGFHITIEGKIAD